MALLFERACHFYYKEHGTFFIECGIFYFALQSIVILLVRTCPFLLLRACLFSFIKSMKFFNLQRGKFIFTMFYSMASFRKSHDVHMAIHKRLKSMVGFSFTNSMSLFEEHDNFITRSMPLFIWNMINFILIYGSWHFFELFVMTKNMAILILENAIFYFYFMAFYYLSPKIFLFYLLLFLNFESFFYRKT